MSAMQTRGIKLINAVFDGYVIKRNSENDHDMNFITEYKDVMTVEEVLADVNKAISGQFNLIDDPDISTDSGYAEITVNGIQYYDQNHNPIPELCSLQDFKDLLIGWRDFLKKPPLNGSKAS